MWFALTQPPYGTSMPQSGRRPQHQSLPKWAVHPMSTFLPLATELRTLLVVRFVPISEVNALIRSPRQRELAAKAQW